MGVWKQIRPPGPGGPLADQPGDPDPEIAPKETMFGGSGTVLNTPDAHLRISFLVACSSCSSLGFQRLSCWDPERGKHAGVSRAVSRGVSRSDSRGQPHPT